MSDYVLELRTSRDLGDTGFLTRLFAAMGRDLPETLRPEFFDTAEPVRKPLDFGDVRSVVHLWSTAGRGLILERKSQPRQQMAFDWRRHRGADTRRFPWGCTVWLAPSAEDRGAETLLKFLVAHLEPSFAFATTEAEFRQRHRIEFRERIGLVQRFVGLDPGETLPGIYWLTFFGRWSIDKIGRERIDRLGAAVIDDAHSGVFVRAYGRASESGSPGAQEIERSIMGQLGVQHFFDPTTIRTGGLRLSEDDALVIEKQIEAKKRRK